MSRSLRSPVEAGSIAYSAVTQPRPRPSIQRGTVSLIEAVQITRVSPCENSADPSAVRDEPGLDRDRPDVAGRAVVAAGLRHRREFPSFEGNLVDGLPDLVDNHVGKLRSLLAVQLGC